MAEKKKLDSSELIKVCTVSCVPFLTSIDNLCYTPSHWHDALEIMYVLEGELTVHMEGTLYQINAGQCFLINACIVHSVRTTQPNKILLLQVPIIFLKSYFPGVEQSIFILDHPADDPVRQRNFHIFRKTLLQMQEVKNLCKEGNEMRFNSLFFDSMFQLSQNFIAKDEYRNPGQKSKSLNRLVPIIDYVKHNYKNSISIDEIAGIISLKPSYLGRFFKKHMGITIREYQNELRMAYIYYDLINTQDTLYEILERHKFTNYKLFYRMFYQYFNITPSQMRDR